MWVGRKLAIKLLNASKSALSDIQDAGRVEELTSVPDGAFSVMVTPDRDPTPVPPCPTR